MVPSLGYHGFAGDVSMNARLFSALRELNSDPAGVYLKRHASMKMLMEMGYVKAWYFGSELHSYDITPAGRAKLKEMEERK